MVAVPAGGGTLILLLGRSIKPLTGQAFSLKRETVAPAGQVSFLGDSYFAYSDLIGTRSRAHVLRTGASER